MTEKETKLIEAIEIVCQALREDKDYYRSWKDNIAMAFKDEYNGTLDCGKEFIHQIANNAADNFLKLLTK